MIESGPKNDGYGIHWYDLEGTNYWEIKINDIKFEGSSAMSGWSARAILDSGTSLIAMPSNAFSRTISILRDVHKDL